MNVLFIDIDSLRADHVGAYGYDANTTPNLDALAADTVRFENAYVANSPCMPSRAALLSGRYGLNNGVETHGPRSQVLNSPHAWIDFDGDPADWRSLPEVFFDDRTPTRAVSSFPRHPSPWFYHLWHEYSHPQEPPGDDEAFQTPRAETVADRAIDHLDDCAGDDFFLYAQFWDPHAPYKRSDEEVEQFRDGPTPDYPTTDQIETHREWDRWRSASDPDLRDALRYSEYDQVSDRGALNELVSHYDAEIRYADRHVGRVLDALHERGVYDETLIVVTADHGEEFGEHGLYREHGNVHDGTQRVPLLIKPPASAAVESGTRSQLVTNVDLAPTITDYAGLDTPTAWQGRSLRTVLADADAAWRDRIVFDHGLYTAQRAVRTERYKFVRTYHAGQWDDAIPDRQLFDMASDPMEQRNVIDEHPDVAERLEREMAVWVENHVGREEDELRAVARDGPAGFALYD